MVAAWRPQSGVAAADETILGFSRRASGADAWCDRVWSLVEIIRMSIVLFLVFTCGPKKQRGSTANDQGLARPQNLRVILIDSLYQRFWCKNTLQHLLYLVIQIQLSYILDFSLNRNIKQKCLSRVRTRCRKTVGEWKDIENDFYANDSPNDDFYANTITSQQIYKNIINAGVQFR